MIKRTMQEWSNFTSCYTAVTVDSSGKQRLHFFANKPIVTNIENLGIFAWYDNKYYMIGTITEDLFVHFDGDWKDSLCIPIDKDIESRIDDVESQYIHSFDIADM